MLKTMKIICYFMMKVKIMNNLTDIVVFREQLKDYDYEELILIQNSVRETLNNSSSNEKIVDCLLYLSNIDKELNIRKNKITNKVIENFFNSYN